MRRWRVVVTLVVAAGTQADAQALPAIRTLAKPDAEFGESMTEIAMARELKDGRVIILDRRERVVSLVDLASGKRSTIGRQGSGPGEYNIPLRLFALGGDTTLLSDLARTRGMLIIGADAKPGEILWMGGGPTATGPSNPEAFDLIGNVYTRPSIVRTNAQGQRMFTDSSAIVRWSRSSWKAETIASYSHRRRSPLITGETTEGNQHLSGQNQLAYAPDGRIAIVELEPYQVTFFSPNGTRTTGPRIPIERISVSEAHKQEYRAEALKTHTGYALSPTGPPRPIELKSTWKEPDAWPPYMPTFGDNALIFAPDGMLWVRRSVPAGAGPQFDVIDRSGRVVRRYAFPPKTRLLAFGAGGAVYFTRSDADDLQYLQRYRLDAR